MQTRNLQLKRALSAALFVLLLSVVGTKNALAQNQVATLQHNDTITGVFYGQNAFVSAHNAAVNGDIITLSSGTFNNCNITKSVTIRGAGCVYDSITHVAPTIIPGTFCLKKDNISFEGIWFTGFVYSFQHAWGWVVAETSNNASFIKCNINKTGYSNVDSECYGFVRNWQFVNCIIKDFVSYRAINNSPCFTGLSVINSVVRFTVYDQTDIYNPTTTNNSIVLIENLQVAKNIIAHNSIFVTDTLNMVSNCTFLNCIGIKTGETSLFEGQTTQNVMEVNSYEAIFETFTGTVLYDNNYQLKDEIANTFLGNDGTEVGVYGGMMPYRTRPNYQIIRICNVAGRTTEDNKLNVGIELFNGGE